MTRLDDRRVKRAAGVHDDDPCGGPRADDADFATVMSIQVGKQLAFIFAGIIRSSSCLYLMAKTAMPLFKAVFKKYDRLNNSVQENVRHARGQDFVREDYETEKVHCRV